MMRHRGGFTIVDMAVGVAAVGLLGAIAVVGLGESRQQARTVYCESRLGVIGMGNAAFAQANNGLMAGFLSEVNGRGTTEAHAAEAVNILRSRGRPDMPAIQGWVPDPGYWSLSLVEFENRSLSDQFNVCPSDPILSRWRRYPEAFDQGRFLPAQPTPGGANKRWPYTSSYDLTGAAYDRNQSRDVGASSGPAVQARLYQNAGTHFTYWVPGGHDVGPSPMAMPAFPSRKVHVFERHQWHLPGINLFFMYPNARTNVLFFDGSVRLVESLKARNGWSPNSPSQPYETFVYYSPQPWEPPLANGQGTPAQQLVSDAHRWTRDGLLGWDYLD